MSPVYKLSGNDIKKKREKKELHTQSKRCKAITNFFSDISKANVEKNADRSATSANLQDSDLGAVGLDGYMDQGLSVETSVSLDKTNQSILSHTDQSSLPIYSNCVESGITGHDDIQSGMDDDEDVGNPSSVNTTRGKYTIITIIVIL